MEKVITSKSTYSNLTVADGGGFELPSRSAPIHR
jgi:hypothetical protein